MILAEKNVRYVILTRIKQPLKLVWDLEFCATQNRKGDLKIAPGYIFCFAYKEVSNGSKNVTGKVKVITIHDYPGKNAIDDKNLVVAITKILKNVDMHIFHFGNKCDFKFMVTRLLRWGKQPLDKICTFDTCDYAYRNLAIKSNSLKSLAYFFGLKESKMEILGDTWLLANAGDKTAIRRIKERCKSDVRLTEQVYKKLLPLAVNHPAIYAMKKLGDGEYTERPKQCQACGKPDLYSQGKAFIGRTLKQRYRCFERDGGCGASVFVTIPSKAYKHL